MRWRLWVGLYVLLLLGTGCKGCDLEPPPPPPPPPPVVVDERHVITVDGITVRYNGQVLPWDAGPERWQQVLGPRSRLVRGISVWDELGVFLYHNDTDTSRPAEFKILLGRVMHSTLSDTEPEFWPQKTFPGRLVVDGAVISKGMSIPHVTYINRNKKGPRFQPGYLDTIYSYYLERFYLRLNFGHDSSLTSFSISPPLPEPEDAGANEQ